MSSTRTSSEVLHASAWLRMMRLTYSDPIGKTRHWESVERTTRHGAVDGVGVFPILERAGRAESTVIVKQYRPPLDQVCIELPAGLIDAGETPSQAAVRELLEETGYVGTVARISCTMSNDPGITNANMQLAVVKVDLDLEANVKPVPQLEPGEFIEVCVVPLTGFSKLLADYEAQGYAIDARLMSIALGMELAPMLQPQ